MDSAVGDPGSAGWLCGSGPAAYMQPRTASRNHRHISSVCSGAVRYSGQPRSPTQPSIHCAACASSQRHISAASATVSAPTAHSTNPCGFSPHSDRSSGALFSTTSPPSLHSGRYEPPVDTSSRLAPQQGSKGNPWRRHSGISVAALLSISLDTAPASQPQEDCRGNGFCQHDGAEGRGTGTVSIDIGCRESTEEGRRSPTSESLRCVYLAIMSLNPPTPSRETWPHGGPVLLGSRSASAAAVN